MSTDFSTAKVRNKFSPLKLLIWGYIIWSLVPVIIAVAYSFNDGRSRSVWQGFSLRWWFTDPHASLWHNDAMRNAIANSLILSISTMLIVTPLGITLAIGAQRIRGRSKIVVQGLTSAPLFCQKLLLVRLCCLPLHVYSR